MPSINVITSSKEIIPPRKISQVYIHNVGPDTLYLRWDGQATVTEASGKDAGIPLLAGEALELFDNYEKSRVADKAVYGISAGSSEVRYIIG